MSVKYDKCHNLVRLYEARHLWILVVGKVIIQPQFEKFESNNIF